MKMIHYTSDACMCNNPSMWWRISLSALSGIDEFNNGKMQSLPFHTIPKAKLNATQFILFTAVLDFFLQGQN